MKNAFSGCDKATLRLFQLQDQTQITKEEKCNVDYNALILECKFQTNMAPRKLIFPIL